MLDKNLFKFEFISCVNDISSKRAMVDMLIKYINSLDEDLQKRAKLDMTDGSISNLYLINSLIHMIDTEIDQNLIIEYCEAFKQVYCLGVATSQMSKWLASGIRKYKPPPSRSQGSHRDQQDPLFGGGNISIYSKSKLHIQRELRLFEQAFSTENIISWAPLSDGWISRLLDHHNARVRSLMLEFIRHLLNTHKFEPSLDTYNSLYIPVQRLLRDRNESVVVECVHLVIEVSPQFPLKDGALKSAKFLLTQNNSWQLGLRLFTESKLFNTMAFLVAVRLLRQTVKRDRLQPYLRAVRALADTCKGFLDYTPNIVHDTKQSCGGKLAHEVLFDHYMLIIFIALSEYENVLYDDFEYLKNHMLNLVQFEHSEDMYSSVLGTDDVKFNTTLTLICDFAGGAELNCYASNSNVQIRISKVSDLLFSIHARCCTRETRRYNLNIDSTDAFSVCDESGIEITKHSKSSTVAVYSKDVYLVVHKHRGD